MSIDSKTQIIVATIGLAGVLGAALIAADSKEIPSPASTPTVEKGKKEVATQDNSKQSAEKITNIGVINGGATFND